MGEDRGIQEEGKGEMGGGRGAREEGEERKEK